MIRKIVLGAATLAIFVTAIGVTMVAAAFALYAVLADDLGPAGAAASVAAASAAIVIIGAALMALKMKGPALSEPEPSIMDRLSSIARDRPVLAAGGALVAGLIALKNPRLAAGLASAFMAGKAADKADPRGRRRR